MTRDLARAAHVIGPVVIELGLGPRRRDHGQGWLAAALGRTLAKHRGIPGPTGWLIVFFLETLYCLVTVREPFCPSTGPPNREVGKISSAKSREEMPKHPRERDHRK